MKRTSLLAFVLAIGTVSAFAAPAQENWDNLCAKCHGADGKAQTALGKKLKIKDYTDAATLANEDDAHLTKDILDGVQKDGKTLMKAFKDDLSADDAKALVEFIRKLSKK